MNSRYTFVGVAIRNGPGIQYPWRVRFSPLVQTDPPVQMVPGLIPAGKAVEVSR
jgi:hypothetical protein